MGKYAISPRLAAASLCLGLVAGLLAYVYLKNQAGGVAASEVQAVVARQKIAAGQIIERGMVEIHPFPQKALPADAALNTDSVIGKVALSALEAGQPLPQSLVAQKGAALGLSYAVPQFMRAVTVALDPIIGVAGFLKPGDHVDVLATFNVNGGAVTKTVLQNIELLATGSQVVQGPVDPNTGKPAENQTQPNATLSVSPTDAEKLILAESKGKLRLALRPYGDISRVGSRGVNSRQVMGVVPPDVPVETPKAAPAPKTYGQRMPPPIIRQTEPATFITQLPEPVPAQNASAGKKVQVVRGTKIEEMAVED